MPIRQFQCGEINFRHKYSIQMTIISVIYFVQSVLNSNLKSGQACSHTIITECELHNCKSHVKIQQIKTVIIRLLRQCSYLTKMGGSRILSKNLFHDTSTHYNTKEGLCGFELSHGHRSSC